MVKVAQNQGSGERVTVSTLENRLVLVRPKEAGETITKYSNGQPSPWVEADVWYVGKDGTPTPIGPEQATSLRIWSEVLVPSLAEAIGEYVAARIVRPDRAYLFDDLTDEEVARCEAAEKHLNEAF